MKEKYKHQIIFASILAGLILAISYFKTLGLLSGILRLFSDNILLLLIIPFGMVIWALFANMTAKEDYFGKYHVFIGRTGILTEGRPEVSDIFPNQLLPVDADRLLQLAGSLAQLSDHPYSQGLMRMVDRKGLGLLKPVKFRSFPGLGIEGQIAGCKTKLGNHVFMKESFVVLGGLEEVATKMRAQGKSVAFVAYDGEPIGVIGFYDKPKRHLKSLIQNLYSRGVTVNMLTSDHKDTAEVLAQELGINRVLADRLPMSKAEDIKKDLRDERHVVMIGEGLGDEHALAAANLSFNVSTCNANTVEIPKELRELKVFLK
ncbi:MAG: hypothetical protein COT91_02055 [Candidatus Doudnabacteria bacterium CG10_big_fil_rev_8_21_14_0_10_41_10]|uniref:Heavy metal translocating P-type ATPase n=1 Tax=Candidatus Doudnabacteria bacterium CG10_big_fil_rev_8_21_14_0_10_41_10 TaxID=1974551 RepID=A0A2H0VDX5_9BACT|nr:MAG: hypothetical protein COT91_02055 [Candidatus Doudnabacteria bacterium CG10_big_fil_rev_8_21_14_0_10_41_10]